MSVEIEEVDIQFEEPVIEIEAREDAFKEYYEELKPYRKERIKRGDEHISLRMFPDVALRLQYLQDKEYKNKGSVVGKVLRKYFDKFFKLPTPIQTELETVGDRLTKIIRATEKLSNAYGKHTGGLYYDFNKAMNQKWQEEKSNWKKYLDKITSTAGKFEKDVSFAVLDVKEISNLDLFEAKCKLLDDIKNIKDEVSSKDDLEKLKTLAKRIRGAIVYATKIEKLIKKYDDILKIE